MSFNRERIDVLLVWDLVIVLICSWCALLADFGGRKKTSLHELEFSGWPHRQYGCESW
jgi:hypothetical protein